MSTEKDSDLNYQKYLTEKLDRGEPNVVVDTVIKLVRDCNRPDLQEIRIADLGCFTGSIINRISMSLPEPIKGKVKLFGFDSDPNIVRGASLVRPHISFHQYNLTEVPPKTKPFQVGILSNVLHEIYSLKINDEEEAKKLVTSSLKNIQDMISIGGSIVILDGILPNNKDREIDIEFLKNDKYLEFIQFTKSGYCVETPCKQVTSQIIKTTLGSLAAFLVKSRYLDTTFWKQESQQVYNYFTQEDFKEALSKCGFSINEQIFYEVPNIKNEIKILDNSVEIPFKNTLIVAKREF